MKPRRRVEKKAVSAETEAVADPQALLTFEPVLSGFLHLIRTICRLYWRVTL